jgi:hypothetical protein
MIQVLISDLVGAEKVFFNRKDNARNAKDNTMNILILRPLWFFNFLIVLMYPELV